MSDTPTLFVSFTQPQAGEADRYRCYASAVTELFRDAGAESSPAQPIRLLHGDTPAATLTLAHFSDPATIDAVVASEAYRALIPDRDASVDHLAAYLIADSPITGLGAPDGVYVIIVGTPNPAGADDLQTYLTGAGPLYGRHGARPVAQLQVTGRPGREAQGEFISFAEFDSAEAAEGLFADPDYQALGPVRDRGLSSLNVYVTT